MANARFLLRPRWLLSHLLVALLVCALVSLGLWQLRRLDRGATATPSSSPGRRSRSPRSRTCWPRGPPTPRSDAARYRRVTATGTYDAGDTVTVRNRSQDGAAGAWLVTPLALASGDRVGVIRGFVGLAADGSAVDAPAPEGDVTVTGQVVAPDRLDGTAPATWPRCWPATARCRPWCWPSRRTRPSLQAPRWARTRAATASWRWRRPS